MVRPKGTPLATHSNARTQEILEIMYARTGLSKVLCKAMITRIRKDLDSAVCDLRDINLPGFIVVRYRKRYEDNDHRLYNVKWTLTIDGRFSKYFKRKLKRRYLRDRYREYRKELEELYLK